MMTTLFLLCIFLLDVQHPPVPKDGIEREFVATQLVEQSLVGCATNPQGGNAFNGDPLSVDWLKPPEPTEQGGVSTWFPEGVSATENAVAQPMSMRVPVDPPNQNPDPNPGDPTGPPIAATPEPSSFAILGITASVLLFLLFGQRLNRRLARRI